MNEVLPGITQRLVADNAIRLLSQCELLCSIAANRRPLKAGETYGKEHTIVRLYAVCIFGWVRDAAHFQSGRRRARLRAAVLVAPSYLQQRLQACASDSTAAMQRHLRRLHKGVPAKNASHIPNETTTITDR